MKLQYTILLMLISDGVDENEYTFLREAFEREGAEVLTMSALPYETIESVFCGQRGKDILVDLPLLKGYSTDFSGVVIPDGPLSVQQLAEDTMVREFIRWCHGAQKPIFASGGAAVLLEDSETPPIVQVDAGTSLQSFLLYASDVLRGKTKLRPVLA